MNITDLETKFKEVTKLPSDINISYYPITDHIGFEIRMTEKKNNGEVFTPLQLVDRMIDVSKPEPDKFNMDLCAGHGQYTIRILRYFTENFTGFDIDLYLKELHWFNEYNIESALALLYIFGENINITIGDARQLKHMPEDDNQVWMKGIYFYDEQIKKWVPKTIKELESLVVKEDVKSKSKVLF